MITPIKTHDVSKAEVASWTSGGRWVVAEVQPSRRKAKGMVTLVKFYNPYDEVVPAALQGQKPPTWCCIVPGRQRTSYFYKKMALTFLRNAMQLRRVGEWFPGEYETHKSLALMYLDSFRKMKGQAA